MPTFEATVTPDGDVRLPEELRRELGIVAGSPVEFFLTLDGQVHFHAITRRAGDLGSFLPAIRKPPVSIREMDDAIGEEVAERDRRSRGGASAVRKPAAE